MNGGVPLRLDSDRVQREPGLLGRRQILRKKRCRASKACDEHCRQSTEGTDNMLKRGSNEHARWIIETESQLQVIFATESQFQEACKYRILVFSRIP